MNPTLPALALAALGLAGCARCSDEPAVPFKLKPPPEAPAPPPTPDAGPQVGTVQAFSTGTDNPEIGGQRLALSGVRAVFASDLDGDGDDDLLALSSDASQRVQLWAITRDADKLGAPRSVPGFVSPEPAGCILADTHFVPLSKAKAALHVELACPPDAALARGTARLDQPHTSASLWLLALEPMPRIFERLDVLALGADGAPAWSLVPRSVDADGDGHDDVALRLSARGALEADSLELSWLDRPSGLVRDVREPEATLSAWAAAAQRQSTKQPEQAIARAELGLRLAQALCRESGAAQLAQSGVPGISCGSLPSLAALSTTLITAYAKRGDVGAAFDHYRQLRRSEPRPSERQLEQARTALLKLNAQPGVTLRHGPAVEPLTQPRVHLPSARFLSDSTLYLHRLNAVLYDLETGTETSAPSASDQLLRDPSGQLIAAAIERTCDGLSVRIERAPPPGSDYTNGAPIANAVLLPAVSAPGCVRGSHRPDDGGFSLLGWAPQGLVAVRGSEVRLVPLGSNGRATGEARALIPDSPRPAPLPGGIATRDGSRYVEATPYGVLLYGPDSTQVELWRPEGYTAIAKGPLEASISPTARRVAVVAGGSVYVLERASVH